MGSRSSVEDARIEVYRQAVEAMARGDFHPPLPAIKEGPGADGLDHLGGALDPHACFLAPSKMIPLDWNGLGPRLKAAFSFCVTVG